MQSKREGTSGRDREVYSRQELVVGGKGLSRLFSSSLCVVGLDGLGAEITKNSFLGGVSLAYLCDSQPVSNLDVSSSICFRHKPLQDFKGTRAEESAIFLQRFNPAATIRCFNSWSISNFAQGNKPDLVVVCNQNWEEAHRIASECRENSIKVILAFTGGLYYVFAQDLGEYTYVDIQPSKQRDVFLFEVAEIVDNPPNNPPNEEICENSTTHPVESSDAKEEEARLAESALAEGHPLNEGVAEIKAHVENRGSQLEAIPQSSHLEGGAQAECGPLLEGGVQAECGLQLAGDTPLGSNALVAVTAQIEGDAQATNKTQVEGTEQLKGDVQVEGNAQVSGDVQIEHNVVLAEAQVCGDLKSTAQVEGDTRIKGNAQIEEGQQIAEQVESNERIDGNAQVEGNARVGDTQVEGNAQIDGPAEVVGEVQGPGNTQVEVKGKTQEEGNVQVLENEQIQGGPQPEVDVRVQGVTQVEGDTQVKGDGQVEGDAQILGDAQVEGDPQIKGDTQIKGYAQVLLAGIEQVEHDSQVSEKVQVKDAAQPKSDAQFGGDVQVQVKFDPLLSGKVQVGDRPQPKEEQSESDSAKAEDSRDKHITCNSGISPKEHRYSAKFNDEYFSLEEGDEVELLEKTGERLGTARIATLDSEASTLVLISNKAISKEIFVQHLPQTVTISFPPIHTIQGKASVPKLMAGLKAFSIFFSQYPSAVPRNHSHFAEFLSLVEGNTEQDKEFFWRFFCTSFASTVPINSILGGIISEQILKILSCCFAPIQEWKGNDFFAYLFQENLTVDECRPGAENGLYSNQILTFGRRFQEVLISKSALVVGAGALGNEIVKGAAMIGLSSSEKSSLVVIDNDVVMTSNLSRQLCFEESDMFAPKAETLCHKVNTLFNAHTKLEPMNFKLTHTTENEVGNKKLKKMDVFISALDNVAARQTLERISHVYGKPMIDGGTDGFDGTQYNFIPLQTSEYFSPYDKLEEVQSCTAKPNVTSKEDVVHNAKIYYEKIVKQILDDNEHSAHGLYALFTAEMKSACTDSTRILLDTSETHEKDFVDSVLQLEELKRNEKLPQFFDKDDIVQTRFLKGICDIISHAFGVPPVGVIEMRQKAGNIIPSIISSTSTIAGFMLLNVLQLANSRLNFVNAALEPPARVILSQPRSFSSDRQYIFHFDNLRRSTSFDVVTRVVPSRFDLHHIIFYGNVIVKLTKRGILAQSLSFGEYVSRKISLGTRKSFVMEFYFERKNRELLIVERETKFLIVSVPKKIRIYRDSLEVQTENKHLQERILELEGQNQVQRIETEKLREQTDKAAADCKREINELNQHQQKMDSEVANLKEAIVVQQRVNTQLSQKADNFSRELQDAKCREEQERRSKQESIDRANALEREGLSKDAAYQDLLHALYQKSSELDETKKRWSTTMFYTFFHWLKLVGKQEQPARDSTPTPISSASSRIISYNSVASTTIPSATSSRSHRTMPSVSPAMVNPSFTARKPLRLFNKGNTCYLASATQLLHAAYVNSNGAFLQTPTSTVGKSLQKLFTTGLEKDWVAFNINFFAFSGFKKGEQDDSGKAFEQITKAEWQQPDLGQPHTISKTFYTEPFNLCAKQPTRKCAIDNFIFYAGPDDESADMAKQISQPRERRCPNGCGSIRERTQIDVWPKILFVVTTSDAALLTSAKYGLSFPSGPQYDLIGASLHSGSTMASGHYTALVKLDNEWWYCSDDSLQKQDIEYNNSDDIIKLLVFAMVL